MREISAVEIQFVAGGLSFGNLGQTAGSLAGGILDSAFKLFGKTTALSTSLGQIGAGAGYFGDSLVEAFFGPTENNQSVAYLTMAIANLKNGVSGLLS